MPFPRGTVVLCQQGNQQPAGRTHSAENALHALDFMSPVIDELVVVAAAAGTVEFLFDGAPREVDPPYGGGFGNQVAVTHERDCYTFYAHLSRIEVERGQQVACGQRLGLAGMTGAAGNRHLHFSLHRTPAGGPGAPPTLPIHALLSAEVSTADGSAPRAKFKLRASDEFVSGTEDPWQGALYASENDGGEELHAGLDASALDASLPALAERTRAALEDRRSLERFKFDWEKNGPAWCEAELAPRLARSPESAPLLYWHAVAVQLGLGDTAPARATFEKLLARGTDSPTWEDWLGPAITSRLARMPAP